ncbi:MAG: type II toxin-antitoxin system VapC family toxin [Longimicrobiales bacterium]
MNTLLDSHTLIWFLHEPERLAAEALRTLRDPARAVYFSAASVWELELKAARGKLTLPEGWVQSARDSGFVELAVSASHAHASAHLPWHHRDPFDRILVAQALEHGLRVATRDPLLSEYEAPILPV